MEAGRKERMGTGRDGNVNKGKRGWGLGEKEWDPREQERTAWKGREGCELREKGCEMGKRKQIIIYYNNCKGVGKESVNNVSITLATHYLFLLPSFLTNYQSEYLLL